MLKPGLLGIILDHPVQYCLSLNVLVVDFIPTNKVGCSDCACHYEITFTE